jgi:hypothetical protein
MTQPKDRGWRAAARQDGRAVLQMVRRSRSRCDFCGGLATAVAVQAGRDGRQVAICGRCLGAAASRIGPAGGGDAA